MTVTGTRARSFLLAHRIAIFIGISITCLCYLKEFLVVRQHLSQINIQLQATGNATYDAARLKNKFFKVLFIVAAFVLCYLPFSLSIRTSNNKRGRTMTLIILLGGSSCIHSVIYFWRIKELKRAAKGQIFRVCKCFSSDKRRSDLTAVDRVLKQWFTQPIIFCNQQHFSHAQIKKCKNQRHNCIFAHPFSRT